MFDPITLIVVAIVAIAVIKLWVIDSERKKRHKSTPPAINQIKWWK